MQSDPSTKGVAARWRVIRRLYPLYLAVSHSFQIGPKPPYGGLSSVTEEQEPGAIEQAEQWMALMDAHIQPHHLRQIMQQTDVAATEPRLLALVQRHASKSNRSQLDSDKLNFVMTQYLWACSPPSFRSREISVADAAEVLEPVLGPAPSEFAPWLKPLQEALEQLHFCRAVAELKEHAFVERGRELRAQLGARYFERSSLLMFAYYNFCLRQAFVRCIAADARHIHQSLDQLRQSGREVCMRVSSKPAPLTIDEVRERVREIASHEVGVYGIDESWKELSELRVAVDLAMADSRSVSPRTTEERVAQLGDRLQKLLEQIDGVRSELAGLRQSGFPPAAPSHSAGEEILDLPLDIAPPSPRPAAPPREVPPVARPEPATAAPSPEPAASAPAPEPAATEDSTAVNAEIARQLTHLRNVLGSAKTATGLIPVGNTAIVLSAAEIDAVQKGTDEAAELIRQGVATRMSLVEKLELAKSGQPQEFGAMRRSANDLQRNLTELLKGGRRPPSDPLSITSRQLAAVLRAIPNK